jgi:hypothetical protein
MAEYQSHLKNKTTLENMISTNSKTLDLDGVKVFKHNGSHYYEGIPNNELKKYNTS